ncbi:MAG: ferredoxin--NADP reductase [Nitrospinota bacterium]
MPIPTQKARLVSTREMGTPHIRELVLEPLEKPIAFRPGQWISLRLPVGERPPLNRAYSMAEPQAGSGRLVLCLDLVANGLGSTYLFSLEAGAELTFAGPFGNFVVPEPLERALVLVARYTGIVPIRCILKKLFAEDFPLGVTLVYGCRMVEDFVYHGEFAAWSAERQNFRYIPTLLGPDGGFQGERRAEVEVLREVVPEGRDYLPMVCGLREFIQPVRAFFQEERGFGRREVKVEHYD